MTQSSGTAATSVEMCAVTATRRPDGTAASATQRAISRQRRAAVPFRRRRQWLRPAAAVGCAPQQTRRRLRSAAIRTTKPNDHSRVWSPSWMNGSISTDRTSAQGSCRHCWRHRGNRDPSAAGWSVRANHACSSGAVGGEREERQPDRDREQAEQPERLARPPAGGPIRCAIESGRKKQAATITARWMMTERAAGRVARQQVGIGVAAQQRGLEEHHRHRPHRRRAAEPRQHHLGEHRLHREQQRGADKDRDGERRQQQAGLRRPPPAAALSTERSVVLVSVMECMAPAYSRKQQYRVRDILSGAAVNSARG